MEHVVADLVAAGLVEPGSSSAAERVVSHALARTGGAAPRAGSTRKVLVEVAGYVGGALVVAAVGLFLAREWNNLSDAAQVVALATVTVVLAGAGAVAALVGGGYAEMRASDEVRRRLASALLAAAAVTAGITVAQQVADLQSGWSDWPSMAGALTTVVLGCAAYGVAPSVLAQVVTAGAAFQAVVTGWSLVDADQSSMSGTGVTVLLLGALWVAATEAGVVGETTAGRVVGGALAVLGAQMPLFDGGSAWLAYGLLAAVAVAGFALYVRTVAWPYLVVGVVGVTLVVPEAVIDWTDGSLGVAGAVLVAGLTLLAASLIGLRVKQEARD